MQTREIKKLLAILCILVVVAGVLAYFDRLPTQSEATNDFSDLSWTAAFEALHETLAQEYAFTEWKGIDWDSLYDTYAPQIAAAQSSQDFKGYYLTLRAYLNEIPDGHVRVNNLKEIDDLFIGGGYGLALANSSDHNIIISWVDPASQAFAAGLRPGTEVVSWNGQPIRTALDQTETLLCGTSATTEYLNLKKLAYLVRAPIGQPVEIGYLGADGVTLATLVAFDDGGQSLRKNYPDAVVSNKLRDMFVGVDNPDPVPTAMVESQTVADTISYVKIQGELDADLQETGKTQSTLELLRDAIASAKQNGSQGLIIDLRNNIGGLDQMAVDMLGFFYDQPAFYEYQNLYNPATGAFEIQENEDGSVGLTIAPTQPHYGGAVIVLINPKCVSSGEGLAMGLQKLPNVRTLGFYGTNGSFGLAGAEALMPGSLTVHWPSGQSLDEQKNIQLDSRNGSGGVRPDLVIPMTAENAIRIANGEDVELAEAIQVLQN
ncbi:S41 family peptidase [Acetobacterium wieringae]|uniref:S41 family peptidase n=1 Tax=Acetobacterium wieringae TaxID=52694 RepID=A0ABY6HHU0_9FIRM|nr:S41 family peptidase [Acetobacterium wieringae]UYO64092.1 S41 family peptidase [Acetobacterium wieringae]VUZ25622.1 Uncharacterised protein [Acetobacterium wieringae]